MSSRFAETRVGAVIERIETGKSVKTQERPAKADELGILRVSAVTWGEFRPTENKAVLATHDPGDCPRPKRGDLLISRANTRELVGAPVQVLEDHPNLLLSDKILRLVPRLDAVEPRYLLRALRSPRARAHFESCAGGTSGSMTNITQDDIRSAPLLLPPVAEQRRIADILDKADAIRRKRKQSITLTDTLLRSTFLDLFGDPITNPKGWPVKPLGDVAEVATGGTPERSNEANFGGGIAWVKTTEVVGSEIIQTEETISEEGLRTSNCRIYPKGSIIVAMYGQGATRGRVGILGVPAATNQACAVLLPSSAYETRYLSTFLALSYLRLRDLGRGGNQPNLNLSIVRAFPTPVPPIELQREFVKRARHICRARAAATACSLEAKFLFESFAQRAFAGEL